MNKKTKNIELLAPAKDKLTAFAAIDCGADAVYIGCAKFGARVKASNSLEDIKDVVDYAHKFNVKVYVTINTILDDDELKKAVDLIHKLYELKVDAIIIQDMGLLECDLPPIKLFASTQCHNSTVQKIQFLEKTGFSRVILARELSLEEIKNISQNTDVEIETFIHGALCVSYSGQCYMSYAIGGRSANKGECAQPCRKRYKLVDSDNRIISEQKHLLCLKDLNLSNDIKNLINAGVSSFKIEGRLKDKDYIKNIVSFYRKKIDEAIEGTDYKKSSSGKSYAEFEPNPDITFNRGYCDYFLNGRKKDITSFDTPKSKGEYIGKVTDINEKYFLLDSAVLNNADGICFQDESGDFIGVNINIAEGKKIYPLSMQGIKKGTKIYRNYNRKFAQMLENSKISRKIDACVKFVQKENFYEIVIRDEDGISEKIQIENTYEPAKNIQQAKNNIIKCFKKSADSCFFISNVEIYADNLPFIAISQMNEMRRTLLKNLENKRLTSYVVQSAKPVEIHPYIEKELFYNTNIMNEKAKEFYEKRGACIKEYALEKTQNPEGKILMTTKHCLRYSLGICKKTGKKTEFKEPFFLVDTHGKKYRLHFDCKNCFMQIKNNAGLFDE